MCLKKWNTVSSLSFLLQLEVVLMSHFIPDSKKNLWKLNRKTLLEKTNSPNQSKLIQSNPVQSSTLGFCGQRTGRVWLAVLQWLCAVCASCTSCRGVNRKHWRYLFKLWFYNSKKQIFLLSGKKKTHRKMESSNMIKI